MQTSKPTRKNSIRNILIVILLLAVVGYTYKRYTRHKKYENISRLDYKPHDKIDYLYYDAQVQQTYLSNCQRLTDVAKVLWLRNDIDVTKTAKGFGQAQTQIDQYNSLLQYTKVIESRLLASRDLKEQGLTNDVIQLILDKGITIGAVQGEKDKVAALDFLKGKNVHSGSNATEVWEMQKLLNANDYSISIDGIFNSITDSALVDFQNKNNLYPSHVCDDITLRKLAE